MLEAANARLAPFYLGYLPNEVLAVRSMVPHFRTAMLKFTLEISVS